MIITHKTTLMMVTQKTRGIATIGCFSKFKQMYQSWTYSLFIICTSLSSNTIQQTSQPYKSTYISFQFKSICFNNFLYPSKEFFSDTLTLAIEKLSMCISFLILSNLTFYQLVLSLAISSIIR